MTWKLLLVSHVRSKEHDSGNTTTWTQLRHSIQLLYIKPTGNQIKVSIIYKAMQVLCFINTP